ncbi:MAG: hypothetical protein DSY82_06525 [Flavobacteriia bacterium]|nr:MAG: hypothetical protein DSY82_06525 [Flavobacteriia bacterium]
MKKLLFILFSILLLSCSTEKKETVYKIVLKNPLSIERTAEPVIITQKKIEKTLGKENQIKDICFEDKNGKKIPFQKDDLNGKTEYCFSIDFKANEIKDLYVKIADKDQKTEFTPYTNIRLGKDANADGIFDDIKEERRDPDHLPGSVPVLYQAEGISWENDKVGFRIYWDKRNGKDIWGKTTDKMVLDSVGLPNTPSYHEIQPWGADVLKVGNSLGAGALAIKKNGKLYRLAETQEAHFKILTEGPVRSVLELKYKGWKVDGEDLDLTETITIWKGKYGYSSDLIIKGSKQKLVTGIVNINLKKDTLHILHPNKKKTVLYTFDQQSEFKDNLGLALIVNTDELVKTERAPDTGTGRSIDGNSPISHTYYVELQNENNKVSFNFYAGWERSNSAFKTKEGFEKMLIEEADKQVHPIIIE